MPMPTDAYADTDMGSVVATVMPTMVSMMLCHRRWCKNQGQQQWQGGKQRALQAVGQCSHGCYLATINRRRVRVVLKQTGWAASVLQLNTGKTADPSSLRTSSAPRIGRLRTDGSLFAATGSLASEPTIGVLA
ncbi:MAG: hypothetical protein ACNA7J_03720 [Wenzhouxiangella sp.]